METSASNALLSMASHYMATWHSKVGRRVSNWFIGETAC